MFEDPYANRDAKWRKTAKGRRKRRGFPKQVIWVLVALVVLGSAFVFWLMNRPGPGERLRETAVEFAAAWPDTPFPKLWGDWFVRSEETERKVNRFFTRLDWLGKRPPIVYESHRVSYDRTQGRVIFASEPTLKEPRLAKVHVHWENRGGTWLATKVAIERGRE